MTVKKLIELLKKEEQGAVMVKSDEFGELLLVDEPKKGRLPLCGEGGENMTMPDSELHAKLTSDKVLDALIEDLALNGAPVVDFRHVLLQSAYFWWEMN